jgi:hypothetical protein
LSCGEATLLELIGVIYVAAEAAAEGLIAVTGNASTWSETSLKEVPDLERQESIC